MSENSTVDIIIPTYNREDLVPRAISSALNQTHEYLNVIVVDDGSEDQTKDIVTSIEDKRLTFIEHQNNKGVSAARNTGISKATGDYFAFLDSDDEWAPDKLEKQLKHLANHSHGTVGVYCDVKKYRKGLAKKIGEYILPQRTGVKGNEELIEEILAMRSAFHPGSTLLVKSDAVEKIGGFDETLHFHEDLDFLLRLLDHGRIEFVDEKLVTLHETAYSPAENIKNSKEEFIDKHLTDERLPPEAQNRVLKEQNLLIATVHYRDGNFKKGTSYLRKSRIPRVRQFTRLKLALFTGVARKITRR